MKKIVVVLLVLGLVVVLSVAASAGQQRTIPIKTDLIGTVIAIGEGKNIFDVELKGRPRSATARGVSVTGLPVEIGELPKDNQCLDIDGPDGFNIVDAQITIVYKNGSMLFGNDLPGGYVCFVSAANPAVGYGYAPYKIVGGNGRYEGADGKLAFDLTTYAFDAPTGAVVAETGTGIGYFTLP